MPSTDATSSIKFGAMEREQRNCEIPCAEVLRKAPVFAGLSDEQLRLVAPPCRKLTVGQGCLLLTKGDEATDLYIVLSGEIYLEEEVSIDERLPARRIVVERVGPNGALGLCGLIKPHRSLFTARCTREAEVIAVRCEDLKALIKAHAGIGLVVLENAFNISFARLMSSHQRVTAELGLAAMYDVHRNY